MKKASTFKSIFGNFRSQRSHSHLWHLDYDAYDLMYPTRSEVA
jgi:hypothetical protein